MFQPSFSSQKMAESRSRRNTAENFSSKSKNSHRISTKLHAQKCRTRDPAAAGSSWRINSLFCEPRCETSSEKSKVHVSFSGEIPTICGMSGCPSLCDRLWAGYGLGKCILWACTNMAGRKTRNGREAVLMHYQGSYCKASLPCLDV